MTQYKAAQSENLQLNTAQYCTAESEIYIVKI